MRVNPPKEGDVIQFVITNVTKSKIALVVKVNGENTLGQEMVEDAACQKWVLDAGKTYSLKGFYSYPENTVVPFKVLNDDDSVARLADWSGSRPRSGYIDVTVFAPNPVLSDELALGPTYRSLMRSQGKQQHPRTAAEARKQVAAMASKGDGKKKRGLIVGGEQRARRPISRLTISKTRRAPFNSRSITTNRPARNVHGTADPCQSRTGSGHCSRPPSR